MLKYKEGVDILSDLGGVKTIAQAQEIFRQKLNPEHQKRLAPVSARESSRFTPSPASSVRRPPAPLAAST